MRLSDGPGSDVADRMMNSSYKQVLVLIACRACPMLRHRSCALVTGLCLFALQSGCALPRHATEPPVRPVTLAPAAQSVLSVGQPTRFSWRAVAGASRYEFHVFDRASGDIERHYLRDLRRADICRIEGLSPDPVCAVEVVLRLPVLDDHAWRVRAGNAAGWSAWTRDLFSLSAR